jgi:hypothetical protein
MEGWVCIGDAKGVGRIFHVDDYTNVFLYLMILIMQRWEWDASDTVPVAFLTTVYRDFLFVLARGVHPVVTISLLQRTQVAELSIERPTFRQKMRSQLALPSGFEVTSFLADYGCGVFFLGSRQGALACYSIALSDSIKLIGVWRRIHDHESIRSIELYGKRTTNVYAEILTTGRDGTYQILRISFPENLPDTLKHAEPLNSDTIDGSLSGIELTKLHRSNLNLAWIEGV